MSIKRGIAIATSAVVAFTATISPTMAQLDKSYFKKIKSEKITSTEAIEWKQFGPGTAGYCEELWCHPSDTKTILIGPDMHVGYGTWNGGESWQGLKDWDGAGDESMRILEVAFSRQNPDLALYIDREGGVKRSLDRGRSWEMIYNTGACLSELAVDPTDDNKWYIGAGDFFNIKDTGRTLAEPHGNMNRRSQYGYILKSTDQGKSWSKITKGLPENADIGKILVNPNEPKSIIALTGHGLYFSHDEGLSWAKGGKGLPNNLPRDLTSHYDKKSGKYTLYLVEQTVYEAQGRCTTASGGVFKSVDNGETWVDITGNLAIDMTQINNYTLRRLYHKTIGGWFGMSIDEASKSYPEMPKSTLSVYHRIRVSPNNPDEIYVTQNIKHDIGFAPSEVWITKDGGESWIASTRYAKYWISNPDEEYWSSRNNPTDVNISFAHLQYNLDIEEAIQGNRFLEVDAAGDIYICIDQQMLCSKDHGATWSQIDDIETAEGSDAWVGRGCSDMPGRQILLDTGVEGRYLLCSGEHGLWQTAPLGDYPDKSAVAVQQIEGQVNHRGAHSIATVAVHPNDPNKIYILMFRQNHRDALRRSVDGGKTWENIAIPAAYANRNTSSNHVFKSSLIIDPESPNNIYFCILNQSPKEVSAEVRPGDFTDFGVYRSRDEGYTWERCNVGLPESPSVHNLVFDPKDPSTLYAACLTGRLGKGRDAKVIEGGLYRTTDRCDSWERVSTPYGVKNVNHVHIDRDGKIYIACGSRNISEDIASTGVWVSSNRGKSWKKVFEMPNVWQIESSPIDPNILILSSAGRGAYRESPALINAGIYISHDGAKSWTKANRGLVQIDKIVDVKPDITDPTVFWCAGWGSGWYKGVWGE